MMIASALFATAQTPTSFSYQGKLTSGSAPANGTFDFQFALCVDETGPTVTACTIGPILRSGVQVTNGIFTTSLDFGPAAFDQPDRFLEISVRPSSGGSFTTLAPRQRIESSPFAIRSNSATIADTALNATSLGGVSSTNYLQRNGDGSQLVNVSGGFKWNVVAANTQMQPNNGYAANSTSELNLTLPANPAVGDVVKLVGAGTGGWRLFTNGGQSIAPDVWSARGPTVTWGNIVSSDSGQKLAGVANGIHLSSDYGSTWIVREASRSMRDIATSADGTKLVAIEFNGFILTSTDSGNTWTPRESARNWTAVASSADGVKLVATVGNGQIYTSSDSGVTWTPRESVRNWARVASSRDGNTLIALTSLATFHVSTDGGETWADRSWFFSGNESIVVTNNGTKFVVAISGVTWESTDFGLTWTFRSAPPISRLVITPDGTKWFAVFGGGQIYSSTNSGVTWKATESNRGWSGIATSADGSKLAAVVLGGRAYVNSLTGIKNSFVELLYIGNGEFFTVESR